MQTDITSPVQLVVGALHVQQSRANWKKSSWTCVNGELQRQTTLILFHPARKLLLGGVCVLLRR